MEPHEHFEECKEIVSLLSEYLTLELPPGACREIDAHLAGCPPCIEFVESLRKTVELCKRYQPAELPEPLGAEARAERKMLESYYLKKDPHAVDVAWPYLGHADRFLRYAARTILEHMEPATWQERALNETATRPSLTALLALVRTGDKSLQPRILEALARIDWTKLDEPLKQELIRVYQLTFIRMGAPPAAAHDKAIARFDAVYPAPSRELNAELCKLLVYLQAPNAATKTMALMAKAPTQEEQMEYALSLRNLKTGWTPEQRKAYFRWFQRAGNYRGGHSFAGFVNNIKKEAVALLSDQDKAMLKPILQAAPKVENPWASAKPRPFVKSWTTEELVPLADKGLHGRNFDHGRQLFGESKCYACHRFNNEGGNFGPDLTILSGRFGPRDVIDKVLPTTVYAAHPDWPKIDWSQVEWLRSSERFKPDLNKSLSDNGLGHKALIRFRTPNLSGIAGSRT